MKKVGRNDPCPCGSVLRGRPRKYKKCHGGTKPPRSLPIYRQKDADDPLRVCIADDPERSCGDCRACCEAMSIESIGKPTGERCPEQCDAGCVVYEERPEECRDYSCWWRAGWGFDSDRPDKLGVIVDTALSDNAAVWYDLPFIVLREARLGALEDAGAHAPVGKMPDNRITRIVREYFYGQQAVIYHNWRDESPKELHASDALRAVLEERGIL